MNREPSTTRIAVSDPFGVTDDPKLPSAARALDPNETAARLSGLWAAARGGTAQLRLQTIRVTRHKPGRRCLIEYEVQGDRGPTLTLIGKVRAKGADTRTCRLVQALGRNGFESTSADGISVPEALGVIPELQMWVQVKAPGLASTGLLSGADGVSLAQRLAEAANKLHHIKLATDRRHTVEDELRLLEERLGRVARAMPGWASRLERVLAGCRRLGAALPEPRWCGIHRDFYPAHALVEGDRLWLVDFDLFCLGDPAVDIGNFTAHLTEQSLRHTGRPDALGHIENAMENRFVELVGEAQRPAVSAYRKLTLARHIFISTQFPDRQALTPRLLALCEESLAGQ